MSHNWYAYPTTFERVECAASVKAQPLSTFQRILLTILLSIPGVLSLSDLIQSWQLSVLHSIVLEGSPTGFSESLQYIWYHGWDIGNDKVFKSFVHPFCLSGFFIFCTWVFSKRFLIRGPHFVDFDDRPKASSADSCHRSEWKGLVQDGRPQKINFAFI